MPRVSDHVRRSGMDCGIAESLGRGVLTAQSVYNRQQQLLTEALQQAVASSNATANPQQLSNSDSNTPAKGASGSSSPPPASVLTAARLFHQNASHSHSMDAIVLSAEEEDQLQAADYSIESQMALFAQLPVFELSITGDVFATYDEYLEALALCHQHIWTCRLTDRSGLTFHEALKSEQTALADLQSFPKAWKGPILQMLHGAVGCNDISELVRRIHAYCKDNFCAGERIFVMLNDESYPGRIKAVYHVADGPATYRVELLHLSTDANGVLESETVIGEAAIEGSAGVVRSKETPVPTTNMIHAYVRTSASRFYSKEIPVIWLVLDQLVKEYALEAPPTITAQVKQMAEDVSHWRISKYQQRLQAASLDFNFSRSLKGSVSSFNPIASVGLSHAAAHCTGGMDSESKMRFPILDEFVPEDRRAADSTWPEAHTFVNIAPTLSTNDGISMVLELWQFLHAFSTTLDVSPVSLCSLITVLEGSISSSNSLLASICNALVKPLARIRRNQESRFANILEEYLDRDRLISDPSMSSSTDHSNYTSGVSSVITPGSPTSSFKYSAGNSARSSVEPMVIDEQVLEDDVKEGEDLQGASDHVNEFETLRSCEWFNENLRSSQWTRRMLSLMVDLHEIPLINSILLRLMNSISIVEEEDITFAQLSAIEKLSVILVLRDLYEASVSLRPIIDKDVDQAATARHKIRELESDRKKTIKELEQIRQKLSEKSTSAAAGSTMKTSDAAEQTEDSGSDDNEESDGSGDEESDDEEEEEEKVPTSRDLKKLEATEIFLQKQIEKLSKKQRSHLACRIRPLGEDRFHRRYWWMDSHLVKGTSTMCRIVLVERRVDVEDDIEHVKAEEDLNNSTAMTDNDGMQSTRTMHSSVSLESAGLESKKTRQISVWSYYNTIEEVDQLLEFLSPLGCREARLGAALSAVRDLIAQSIDPTFGTDQMQVDDELTLEEDTESLSLDDSMSDVEKTGVKGGIRTKKKMSAKSKRSKSVSNRKNFVDDEDDDEEEEEIVTKTSRPRRSAAARSLPIVDEEDEEDDGEDEEEEESSDEKNAFSKPQRSNRRRVTRSRR